MSSLRHVCMRVPDGYRCSARRCEWRGDLVGSIRHAISHQYVANEYADNIRGPKATSKWLDHMARFERFVVNVASGRKVLPPGMFLDHDEPPPVRIRADGSLDMDEKVARSYRSTYQAYLKQVGRDRHEAA